MRWSDISVLGKLMVGFGTVIVGVMAIVSFNFLLSRDVREGLDGLVEVSAYEQSLLKAEIAHHAWAAAVSDYILTNGKKIPNVAANGRECVFGKWYYGQGRVAMEKMFPELASSLAAVDEPHTRLHDSLQGIKAAMDVNNTTEAQRIFETQSQVGLAGVRDNLGKALAVLDKYSVDYTKAVSSKVEENIIYSLIAGFVLLVCCIAFALVLGNSISVPLKRLVAYAREVAGGNLREPRIHQKDEVGMLSDALGVMILTLKSKIEEAHSQAETAKNKEAEAGEAQQRAETAMRSVASKHSAIVEAVQSIERVVSSATEASSRLSVQINQSERGASIQSQRISQVVSSMDDMNNTVLEVSRSAGSAEQFSTSARSKAEDGAEVVQQAVRSIRMVQEQSITLRDGMQTLDEHARAISRIMAVISDIADQTNLLALNAAIEAARAGEAGRGFAVVADEVRKLAEKTMASTTDVASAISAIQKSAESSMHQMDNAVEQIEQATGLANKSGDALRDIVSMVDQTAGQVRAIAQASDRQSSCSDSITRAIEEVNTVSSETALSMRDAAKAVNDLTEQTSVLSGLMDHMRKDN